MSDDDNDQQQNSPNLVELLRRRLPELGLDYDTYGPYVWGTPEEDEEELQGVVQLLQASSEEFADHDDVWTEFTTDVQEAVQRDVEYRKQRQEDHLEEERQKMEEQLAKAKLEEAPAAGENSKKQGQKSSMVDEETKRRLMQQYAYEDAEEVDGGGGGGGGKGGGKGKSGEEDVPLTNKQIAARASLEQAQEARTKKVQTKKEEQQKTKEQKLNKQQLKEERRKRTTKGERKGRG